jgi:alkaline phosphatase D
MIFPFIWTSSSIDEMKEIYNKQKEMESYKNFINLFPVTGIWDDHDYGKNNGGKEYEDKTKSQKLFLDFLDEPEDSIRRKREGLYISFTHGIPGKKG